MNEQEKLFSRRQMLEMAVGLGSLTALGNSVFGQQAKPAFTPWVEIGPFYPVLKPLDEDADLTIIKGHKARAEGQIIHVAGRVLNLKGEPVKGAKIEIWQANTHGRYVHKSDPNPAPPDPNFQGSAILKTDAEGRYRFKTIKPGSYPVTPTEQRAPHIHFDITGKTNRLTTQMFFPDESLNAKDVVFNGIYLDKNAVLAKQVPPTKEIGAGELLLGWDIILIDG